MKLSLLFVALCLPALSQAQNFVIADKIFQPAYTNSSNEGFLEEYLPANQTLENWTNLFAIRYFKKIDSPEDYIAQLGGEYHKEFPWMKFASYDQKSKNRWFVDFVAYQRSNESKLKFLGLLSALIPIIPSPKPDESKFLEWNFFRAQTNAVGNGIIVFQYAKRIPNKESTNAWQEVTLLRKQMIPFLATNEFELDFTQLKQLTKTEK